MELKAGRIRYLDLKCVHGKDAQESREVIHHPLQRTRPTRDGAPVGFQPTEAGLHALAVCSVGYNTPLLVWCAMELTQRWILERRGGHGLHDLHREENKLYPNLSSSIDIAKLVQGGCCTAPAQASAGAAGSRTEDRCWCLPLSCGKLSQLRLNIANEAKAAVAHVPTLLVHVTQLHTGASYGLIGIHDDLSRINSGVCDDAPPLTSKGACARARVNL
mmetsp:Transcript_13249/g.35357  ORF Transcript_13249/g.35357 Transcript_13249/m.35357 type:complete len:218 (+) Transcript_13249:311-964(+)